MSDMRSFIAALKLHLRSCGKSFTTTGDDPYAFGDTEGGFFPETVVDLSALETEIDAFAATFSAKSEAANV